jgi:hypothetical protein
MGVDVFEVRTRLGQDGQFGRHPASLIGHLAAPDMHPIQFEAHDALPPE